MKAASSTGSQSRAGSVLSLSLVFVLDLPRCAHIRSVSSFGDRAELFFLLLRMPVSKTVRPLSDSSVPPKIDAVESIDKQRTCNDPGRRLERSSSTNDTFECA